MLEGKKVKVTFHAVVANCCGNVVVSSIILNVAIRSMKNFVEIMAIHNAFAE
jgi:hypothetical protein